MTWRGRLAAVAVVAGMLAVASPLASAVAVSNLRYGTNSGQSLDAYPAGSPGAPVVVVVHGGGWTTGDKSDPRIVQVSKTLQADGFAVFSVNYRLASATRDGVPEQADDVASAVGWIVANAANYNGDRSDISLVGGSAGGQLVSLAGQQINVGSPRLVDRIASFSGPMDFTADPAALSSSRASYYLGCRISACTQAQLRGPSPIYNITPASPRFWIVNSRAELTPLGQATSMDAALSGAGIPSTLVVPAGSGHAFALFDQLHDQLVAFLKS